jgi:hypothetical protein
MALTSWATAEPGPVAWVGVDGYDSRPGRVKASEAGIST